MDFQRALREVDEDPSCYIGETDQESTEQRRVPPHTLLHKKYHGYHGQDNYCLALTNGKDRWAPIRHPSHLELVVYRLLMKDRMVVKTPEVDLSLPSKTKAFDKKWLRILGKILSPLLRLFGVGR